MFAMLEEEKLGMNMGIGRERVNGLLAATARKGA